MNYKEQVDWWRFFFNAMTVALILIPPLAIYIIWEISHGRTIR